MEYFICGKEGYQPKLQYSRRSKITTLAVVNFLVQPEDMGKQTFVYTGIWYTEVLDFRILEFV